jgi:hypothetical protein
LPSSSRPRPATEKSFALSTAPTRQSAEHGKVEVELGRAEYLRQRATHTLVAPSTRFNYGFAPDWEAVVEGRVAHGLSGRVHGTSLIEDGALLK